MFVNGMHVHAKYDQCMHNHCYIIHIHVHLQYTCLHVCIVDTQIMALLIHVTYCQSLLTFLVIHFQL